jgi:hypothetical protein
MIDTSVTFNVLPDRTAEFERLYQELLARICAQTGCVKNRRTTCSFLASTPDAGALTIGVSYERRDATSHCVERVTYAITVW